jgi:hypothetical protein
VSNACSFHNHPGPDPCPYCLEKGTSVGNPDALAFDRSTVSYEIPGSVHWVDCCPHCASADLRENKFEGYTWCGQCGANDKAEPPLLKQP